MRINIHVLPDSLGCRQAFHILPPLPHPASPPQPSFSLSFHLSRQTHLEVLATCMQAKFFVDPWLYNLLLDKAGLPQAQAAVGASASATEQDVNKVAAKFGSGLSTGGR